MNEEIISTIKDVVMDVFDIDDSSDIELSEESKIEDYSQWDSLAHINIITQLEAIYSIRFSLNDIEEFVFIKDIVAGINARK